MVKELKTTEEFANAIGDEKNGLVVIDFFTDWCGPCKKIAPKFAEFAEKYPAIGFYKINADNENLVEVIDACMVKSLPTFCLFCGGKYVTCTVGANEENLEKLILQTHQKFNENEKNNNN